MRARTGVTAIGVAVLTAALLAGCSSDKAPTPSPETGNQDGGSTKWREPTNQVSIAPGSGGYVDPNDTTRQDGEKTVKYLSEDAPFVNSAGEEDSEDQNTVFKVTASKVEPAGESASVEVTGLKLDKGELTPQKFTATDVKLYTVSVKTEYVSGYKDSLAKPAAPLFWPVSSTGATSYIVSGDSASLASPGGGTETLTVAAPKDAAAPVGVRYIQFNSDLDDTLSPTVDVFAAEGVKVD